MRKLQATFGCLALSFVLACGGGGESGSGTPDVAATPPAGAGSDESGMAAGEPGHGETAASIHPTSQRCLDLVAAAEFQKAVPVCLEAVGIDPDNEEVARALDDAKKGMVQAQAEAADLAEGAAGSAADAAGSAADAAGSAADAADEAAKGLMEKPRIP